MTNQGVLRHAELRRKLLAYMPEPMAAPLKLSRIQKAFLSVGWNREEIDAAIAELEREEELEVFRARPAGSKQADLHVRRRRRFGLIVRHRWLGDPLRQLYRCTPKVPSLYRSRDPLCPGCGVELLWKDLPRLGRFRGVSSSRILAEDLGCRLDLRLYELQLEEARRAS